MGVYRILVQGFAQGQRARRTWGERGSGTDKSRGLQRTRLESSALLSKCEEAFIDAQRHPAARSSQDTAVGRTGRRVACADEYASRLP